MVLVVYMIADLSMILAVSMNLVCFVFVSVRFVSFVLFHSFDPTLKGWELLLLKSFFCPRGFIPQGKLFFGPLGFSPQGKLRRR